MKKQLLLLLALTLASCQSSLLIPIPESGRRLCVNTILTQQDSCDVLVYFSEGFATKAPEESAWVSMEVEGSRAQDARLVVKRADAWVFRLLADFSAGESVQLKVYADGSEVSSIDKAPEVAAVTRIDTSSTASQYDNRLRDYVCSFMADPRGGCLFTLPANLSVVATDGPDGPAVYDTLMVAAVKMTGSGCNFSQYDLRKVKSGDYHKETSGKYTQKPYCRNILIIPVGTISWKTHRYFASSEFDPDAIITEKHVSVSNISGGLGYMALVTKNMAFIELKPCPIP